MPDSTGYSIRTLEISEAAAAAAYSASVANPDSPLSNSFCRHHHATIFLCIGPGEIWTGMLAAYISPLHAGTAVLENLSVSDVSGKHVVQDLLLDYVLSHFKAACVFRIEVCGELYETNNRFFEDQAFREVDTESGLVYRRQLLPGKICLQNRRMRPKMNTINGEVSEETLFQYYQQDEVIWGTYSGGPIRKGMLLGRMAKNGNINFDYLQLNTNNEVSTGISHAATEFLNDGRIVLYEDWEWTGSKSGGGRSVTEEIKE